MAFLKGKRSKVEMFYGDQHINKESHFKKIYNIGIQNEYEIMICADTINHQKILDTISYLCIKQNIQALYDLNGILTIYNKEFSFKIGDRNIYVVIVNNKLIASQTFESYIKLNIPSNGQTIGEVIDWFNDEIDKEYKIFEYKSIDTLQIRLFNINSNAWLHNKITSLRTWDSIFLQEQVKNNIIADIKMYPKLLKRMEKFPNSNRRIIMFHGPPGTGKTSLAMAIASEYKSPLYKIQTSIFNDESLSHALSIAGYHNFNDAIENKINVFLIEDTDQLFIDGSSNVAGIMESSIDNPTPHMKTNITFSGILNILDGVEAPTNCLFILTSNRATSYDDAVLRRINRYWRIEGVDEDSIRQHIKFFEISITEDNFAIAKDKIADSKQEIAVKDKIADSEQEIAVKDKIADSEQEIIVKDKNNSKNNLIDYNNKVIKTITDIMIEKKYEHSVLKECITRAYYSAAENDKDPILSDVLKQIVEYVPLKKEIKAAKPNSFIQDDGDSYYF